MKEEKLTEQSTSHMEPLQRRGVGGSRRDGLIVVLRWTIRCRSRKEELVQISAKNFERFVGCRSGGTDILLDPSEVLSLGPGVTLVDEKDLRGGVGI